MISSESNYTEANKKVPNMLENKIRSITPDMSTAEAIRQFVRPFDRVLVGSGASGIVSRIEEIDHDTSRLFLVSGGLSIGTTVEFPEQVFVDHRCLMRLVSNGTVTKRDVIECYEQVLEDVKPGDEVPLDDEGADIANRIVEAELSDGVFKLLVPNGETLGDEPEQVTVTGILANARKCLTDTVYDVTCLAGERIACAVAVRRNIGRCVYAAIDDESVWLVINVASREQLDRWSSACSDAEALCFDRLAEIVDVPDILDEEVLTHASTPEQKRLLSVLRHYRDMGEILDRERLELPGIVSQYEECRFA